MKSSIWIFIIFICFVNFTNCETIVIKVGERGLSFSPQNVSAKQDDVIQWEYIYGKHQIVQSDGPAGNCIKSRNLNAFDSGLKEEGVFSMTITQTRGMIYYFCSYSSHCAYGMWGVIKIDPDSPGPDQTTVSTPVTANAPNSIEETNDTDGMSLPIIIGISIGGFFTLSILGLIGFVLYRRKKYQKQFDISMQPYDPKLIAGDHGGPNGGSNLVNMRGSVGMASVSSLGNNTLSRSNTQHGHSNNEVIPSNRYNQNQPYGETAMNYMERTSGEYDGGNRLFGGPVGPVVGDNESNNGEVPISPLSPPPMYHPQYGNEYQQGPPIPPHPNLIPPQQQYGAPYLAPHPTNIYPQYGPSSIYQESQSNNTSDPFGPSHPGQYAYQQPPPHQQQSGQYTINPAQYYGSNKSDTS